MECVILAGGKGSRLAPLTDNIAKPLISVNGKPLLEHLLELVYPKFDKLIIVVDHFAGQIEKYIENHKFKNRIVFAYQKPNLPGTMGALLSAEDNIEKDFLVICADNLYCSEDIENVKSKVNSILIRQVDQIQKDTQYKTSKFSLIKNKHAINLEAGAWHLEKDFFKLKPILVNNTNEYGIPHTIYDEYKRTNNKYTLIYSTFWYPVGTIWELNFIQNYYQNKL